MGTRLGMVAKQVWSEWKSQGEELRKLIGKCTLRSEAIGHTCQGQWT